MSIQTHNHIIYIDYRKRVDKRNHRRILTLIKLIKSDIIYYFDLTENNFDETFIKIIDDYLIESKMINVLIDISDQKFKVISKYFIFDDQSELKKLLPNPYKYFTNPFWKDTIDYALIENNFGLWYSIAENIYFNQIEELSRRYDVALEFYLKAAKGGHYYSMIRLEEIYRLGIGTEKNDDIAKMWIYNLRDMIRYYKYYKILLKFHKK